MKKFLNAIGAILVFCIAWAAIRLASSLPADSKTHIEQKYAGWSGVLQAAVCSRWQPGGSFIRWLNRCAADFEKQHDGVYIEFISCDEDDLAGISEIYTPDMIFFSPGIIESGTGARAVCMGGYAWVYNRSLTDESSIYMKSMPDIQPDTDAYCYSAATIALLSGDAGAGQTIPDTAMDIGLPASNTEAGALSRFIGGEIPCLAVSSADLSRLQKLQNAGRGPDWTVAYSNGAVFTDQVLYMVEGENIPADGRAETIAAFAEFLVNENCQGYLSDIGAIPVNGISIYPPHSPHSAIEAAILRGGVIAPDPFSEYSAAESADIVRSFISGETGADQAISNLLSIRRVKGR